MGICNPNRESNNSRLSAYQHLSIFRNSRESTILLLKKPSASADHLIQKRDSISLSAYSDTRQHQFISLFRYPAASIHQLIQIIERISSSTLQKPDSFSLSAYSDNRENLFINSSDTRQRHSSAYSDTRQRQLNPNNICKGKQSVQVHSSLELSETFKTPPPYRIKWKKVKNIRPPKKP